MEMTLDKLTGILESVRSFAELSDSLDEARNKPSDWQGSHTSACTQEEGCQCRPNPLGWLGSSGFRVIIDEKERARQEAAHPEGNVTSFEKLRNRFERSPFPLVDAARAFSTNVIATERLITDLAEMVKTARIASVVSTSWVDDRVNLLIDTYRDSVRKLS